MSRNFLPVEKFFCRSRNTFIGGEISFVDCTEHRKNKCGRFKIFIDEILYLLSVPSVIQVNFKNEFDWLSKPQSRNSLLTNRLLIGQKTLGGPG